MITQASSDLISFSGSGALFWICAIMAIYEMNMGQIYFARAIHMPKAGIAFALETEDSFIINQRVSKII